MTKMAANGQAPELASMLGRLESEFRGVLDNIAADIGALRADLGVEGTGDPGCETNADLVDHHLPTAGNELDAVVEMTESASHTIMEAAEGIMAFDGDDPDAYRGFVEGEMMKVIEACAFQDITGQRISKVVATLNLIEKRLIGFAEEHPKMASDDTAPSDDDLLNGPALDGDGLAQSDIDALLNSVA